MSCCGEARSVGTWPRFLEKTGSWGHRASHLGQPSGPAIWASHLGRASGPGILTVPLEPSWPRNPGLFRQSRNQVVSVTSTCYCSPSPSRAALRSGGRHLRRCRSHLSLARSLWLAPTKCLLLTGSLQQRSLTTEQRTKTPVRAIGCWIPVADRTTQPVHGLPMTEDQLVRAVSSGLPCASRNATVHQFQPVVAA